MKLRSTVTLLLTTTLTLVACSNQGGISRNNLSGPPDRVKIRVFITENGCTIETQTEDRSCPFANPGNSRKDPLNVACQSPSENANSRRKIVWESADPTDSDNKPEFWIEFEGGDSPFKSTTTGKCKLAEKDDAFTCNLRKKDEQPPLEWDYKYDVVVSDGSGGSSVCRLDPRVFLMQ
jgi:hypothetical protein